MNTKLIMTLSAICLLALGSVLSFFPNEVIDYFKIESNTIIILFIKLLGALYWGFGILNWMSKSTLIGGIYNRPIALGNLTHYLVGVIFLVKMTLNVNNYSIFIMSLTIVYLVFTLLFFFVFNINPVKVKN